MTNVEDTVDKEYIDKHEAYLLLKQKAETYMLPATKEAYEKAAILIDSLPTIEAQPDNGWISVEERLPEVFKNVLTIDSEGKIFINWLEDIIEMKGYFAYGSGSVTHWQPLPEPPKEVENETD